MTYMPAPSPADYAPYHTYAAFERGVVDYYSRHLENPYNRDGVAAQAWDRGYEYAMRYARYQRGV